MPISVFLCIIASSRIILICRIFLLSSFKKSSALAGLPNSRKEKLLPDVNRRKKLQDREISAAGALQMFHESIHQDNCPPEQSRLQTIPNDLLLLLQECPDVQVPEELTRVP